MSDTALREKLIRLANQVPTIRQHILPLLSKEAGVSPEKLKEILEEMQEQLEEAFKKTDELLKINSKADDILHDVENAFKILLVDAFYTGLSDEVREVVEEFSGASDSVKTALYNLRQVRALSKELLEVVENDAKGG